MQAAPIFQNKMMNVSQRVDGAVVAAVNQFASADVGKDGFIFQSRFVQRNERGKRAGAGKKYNFSISNSL